jgi:antirestriction protein ArdC
MENNNLSNQNTQTKKTNPAREKFKELTEKFIADLEAGVEPWKKSWNLSNGLPSSALTNGQYSGINLISLLSENQFKSNKWITAKQVDSLNGKIKKEELENSKDIFFIKNMTKLVEKENKETGEIEEIEENYKILKNYKVWNTEQVEGINFQQNEEKSKNEKIEEVEEFLKSFNLKIYPGSPGYSPRDDVIFMPDIENFTNSENYYSTIFHELSHWSGHPQRLDRIKNISKYDDIYAMEELIAELSSAFLCSEKGISMDTTQHSEYLGSWVKSLKANPYILFSASSHASKATNYLEKLSEKSLEQKQGKKKLSHKSKFNTPKVA